MISESQIWQDWLKDEVASSAPSFFSYLHFIMIEQSGYGWYNGKLQFQTAELAETETEDTPFTAKFKVNPRGVDNPIFGLISAIDESQFLINIKRQPTRFNGLKKTSALLSIPANVDFCHLGFSLVLVKNLLLKSRWYLDEEQAGLLDHSACILASVVDNIPNGEGLMKKFSKELMSSLDKAVRH